MATDILISYHTDSSLHLAEAVCHSMEEKGLRCWYAARDAKGAYAHAIVEAIDECRIFLLLLNRESSFSEDVLNEINLAFERLRRGENIIIMPFKIADEEISKSARYYIGRMHWIDAITPPMEERIRELTAMVYDLLCGNHLAKSQKKKNVLLPNYNFVGRQKELEQINESLRKDRVLFLQGMGGTGKTELAKQFVAAHQTDYDEIIFMSYGGSLQEMIISEQYFDVGGVVRGQESDQEFAERKLMRFQEATSEKTLLVLDNFDVQRDEFLEALLSGPYQCLITTRVNFEDTGLPILQLDVLSKEEQWQLFRKFYKRPMKEAEKADIEAIMDAVQGHTLAIELIAKFMAKRRFAAEEVKQVLQKSGISPGWNGVVSHGLKKEDSVYAHLKALFRVEELSWFEMTYMMNLSILPFSGVAVDDFFSWYEYGDGITLDDLVQRGWIQYDVTSDFISLHPVVSDVVRNECEVTLESCKEMFLSLCSCFAESWKMDAKERAYYGEIAKAIYRKYPLSEETYYSQYEQMFLIFKNLGYFDLCQKLLDEMEKMRGESAEFYYQKADFYLQRMQYEEAISNLKKSIRLYESSAPDSVAHGTAVKYLAHVYHAYYKHVEKREDYVELAWECLEESGRIFRTCIPWEHEEMGSQQYAMATNAYYRGDYDMALLYAESSMEIFTNLNGEMDADTTSPMRMLALIHSKLGHLDEALVFINRTLEIREQLWGREQFRYLDCYESKADIYLEQGMPEKAMAIYKEILELIGERKEEFAVYVNKIQQKMPIIGGTKS